MCVCVRACVCACVYHGAHVVDAFCIREGNFGSSVVYLYRDQVKSLLPTVYIYIPTKSLLVYEEVRKPWLKSVSGTYKTFRGDV